MKVHTIDLCFKGNNYGIAAFLVEYEAGIILVETGPHSTYDTLEKGIRDIGYQVEDISHVLLTHIHLDHAGAAWVFAEKGANIYLHPVGYRHMHDPSKLLASAQRIYGDQMDALWGTLKPIPAAQLHTMEHEQELTLDNLTFVAHYTPGHATHHIAWQLRNVLFAGDVAGIRVNQGPVIPPTPPPDIHIEHWIESIDHLLTINEIDTYYLTHFGKATGVKEHMTELKATLHKYANFFKEPCEQGKSVESLLPSFQQFVREHLISLGVKDQDLDVYEYANPSVFSAYGLMRYWKKKMAE